MANEPAKSKSFLLQLQDHLLARMEDLDGAKTDEDIEAAVKRAEATADLAAEGIKAEAGLIARAEIQLKAVEMRSRVGTIMPDMPDVGVSFTRLTAIPPGQNNGR